MLTTPFTVTGNSMAPSLSPDNFSDMTSWILDSGASRHMTGCRYILFNIVNIAHVFVSLPNGSETMSNCEGSIFFSSKIFLQNVLYTPNLAYQLVSIPKLLPQNPCHYVGIADDFCVIQDRGTRTKIRAGRLTDDVFHYSSVQAFHTFFFLLSYFVSVLDTPLIYYEHC